MTKDSPDPDPDPDGIGISATLRHREERIKAPMESGSSTSRRWLGGDSLVGKKRGRESFSEPGYSVRSARHWALIDGRAEIVEQIIDSVETTGATRGP